MLKRNALFGVASLAFLAGIAGARAENPAAAPLDARAYRATPREVIFVIDTSASMCGRPLEEAKRTLAAALARLGDEDRFNVFRFGSTTSSLHRAPVARTPEAYSRALDWVASLRAGGTSHMETAIGVALDEPVAAGYSRRVLVLSDGGVANEAAILALIEQRLARARLFTAGFGPAPRADFLRKAAAVGGGRYTSVADRGPPQAGECASELATTRVARFGFAAAAGEAELCRRIAAVLLVAAAAGVWLLSMGVR